MPPNPPAGPTSYLPADGDGTSPIGPRNRKDPAAALVTSIQEACGRRGITGPGLSSPVPFRRPAGKTPPSGKGRFRQVALRPVSDGTVARPLQAARRQDPAERQGAIQASCLAPRERWHSSEAPSGARRQDPAERQGAIQASCLAPRERWHSSEAPSGGPQARPRRAGRGDSARCLAPRERWQTRRQDPAEAARR